MFKRHISSNRPRDCKLGVLIEPHIGAYSMWMSRRGRSLRLRASMSVDDQRHSADAGDRMQHATRHVHGPQSGWSVRVRTGNAVS